MAHGPSSNITWSDISVTQPKKKSTLHARSTQFNALQSPFARLSFVVFFVFKIAHFLRLLSTPRAFLGIVGVDIEGRTHIQVENTRKISVFS